jgi:hypothetical protein
MPYKPREIEKMLTRKLEMSVEDADHKWFKLDLEGLPPIRTKLPNHKGDIKPKLEGRICNQLRVRKTFFHGLMDCTKKLQDYEKQIRNDPFPPFDHLLV